MAFLNRKYQLTAVFLALVDLFASFMCFFVLTNKGTQMNATLGMLCTVCLAVPTFLLWGVLRNKRIAVKVYIIYNYMWNIVYAVFFVAFFLSVLNEPEKFINILNKGNPENNIVPLQITALTSLFMVCVVTYSQFVRYITHKALLEMDKNHDNQIFL